MLDSLLSQEGMQYKIQKESNSSLSSSDQQQPSKKDKSSPLPKRWVLNVLLIILTSFEVVIIVHSQVYLHGDLLRSFLNFYADYELYPEIFRGGAFYLNVHDISQVRDHINYVFEQITKSSNETLVDIHYKKANITLQVQYHPKVHASKPTKIYPIDPSVGIVDPFDGKNLTEIQQFLLDTHYFEIVIDNLEVQNDGLFERYIHRIIYHYENGNQININYDFSISNSLVSNIEIERPQANFLILLRVFYVIILILALLSFYLNANYILRIFKQFYSSVQNKARNIAERQHAHSPSIHEQMSGQEIAMLHDNIDANIRVRKLTLNNLRWRDYFDIVEVEVLFNVVANIMQIIGNFQLLFGREHEVMIGVGCLFSWLTIFQLLRKYKRLVIMYTLIKMSTIAVMQFMVSFLIIFMGYTCLGMCLFPKVTYFESMSKGVTTLASMMAGDSIRDITEAMDEKANTLLVIIYIFSYIVLFMHAIHNTLISILKEYYILKKIEMLKEKKRRENRQTQVYIEEAEITIEKQLQQAEKGNGKYPVNMSIEIVKEIVKMNVQKQFRGYNHRVRDLLRLMENIIVTEKWEMIDQGLHKEPLIYEQMLETRLKMVGELLISISLEQTLKVEDVESMSRRVS